MSEHISPYLKAIEQALRAGSATEHTHRPALKTLLEALAPGVTATNEPKRIECGAPDYIITRGAIPLGYVEAKDVGTSLDVAERTEQMRRYRHSLSNLILTDYLEFRWYVEGEHRETVRLGSVTKDGGVKRAKGGEQTISDMLQRFFDLQGPSIGTPKELAERMAALARMTRNLIEETFRQETEQGMLHTQLEAFRDTLIPNLTPPQFADMYAQTITYGLFAACLRAPTGQNFTREKAAWNLPKTNPFLRRFFNEIAGPDLDERIAWLVDDLAHLLARADMAGILRGFGKRTRQEDPVVHFYETFLTAYDPEMRQARGVYYTPEPVVSYIVHSLDHILKTRFDRPLGLADTNTLILDPAVGTATFLYFVIQHIHDTLRTMGQAGTWNDYVKNHLLRRIFGFELLMAPYAVAHMKLGIFLQETGYDFTGDQRLGIYLTNSLEEAITQAATLGFARFISDEANAAEEVKRDKPIMVVLGNPPYSVSSANRGEWITKLIEEYKKGLDEKKISLDDDYIKFIRFAQWRTERTGQGVIGLISNNSYLSGLTHWRMRQSLLETFDKAYVLNLHGNARMKETAPDGSPDENVFDIMQGVAIVLLIKDGTKDGQHAAVFYDDLFGMREHKYEVLLSSDVQNTEWQELQPVAPLFFWVPKDFERLTEYEKDWKMTDIFGVNGTGVKTDRDEFCFDFDKEILCNRTRRFFAEDYDEAFQEHYRLYPSSSYDIEARRDACAFSEENIRQCLYRPFDRRWVYYGVGFTSRPGHRVMQHILSENMALLCKRQSKRSPFSYILICNEIAESSVFESAYANNSVFPLYLYTTPEDTKGTLFATEEVTREPNLAPKFIAAVEEKLGLDFVPDGKGDLQSAFGPEDVLHYAYAVFHSPTYRERYAELLKIDFPRLPLTSDRDQFKMLATKGEELVALHLMKSSALNQLTTSFPVTGSNGVVKVRYTEPRKEEKGSEVPGRVYINKTQYFEGIEPDVWAFQIGGYQVLQKWLKDRKGRKLSFDDLFHYQRIVVALKETICLMAEIDEVISDWPMR
ncbi:MAG: type ISP restriction/modification enzyme [Candidatus Latescibacterota bacterium]